MHRPPVCNYIYSMHDYPQAIEHGAHQHIHHAEVWGSSSDGKALKQVHCQVNPFGAFGRSGGRCEPDLDLDLPTVVLVRYMVDRGVPGFDPSDLMAGLHDMLYLCFCYLLVRHLLLLVRHLLLLVRHLFLLVRHLFLLVRHLLLLVRHLFLVRRVLLRGVLHTMAWLHDMLHNVLLHVMNQLDRIVMHFWRPQFLSKKQGLHGGSRPQRSTRTQDHEKGCPTHDCLGVYFYRGTPFLSAWLGLPGRSLPI